MLVNLEIASARSNQGLAMTGEGEGSADELGDCSRCYRDRLAQHDMRGEDDEGGWDSDKELGDVSTGST